MPLTSKQQDLAAEFIGLARGQAWSYFKKSTGMELDDCLSAAMLGLVTGIEAYPGYCAKNNFDAEAGHRSGWLKAYLLRRIRGAILDAARSADHMTRSDRHKIKAVRQAEDDGARTDAERAAATGLSVAEVRRVEADARMSVSLDDQDELSGAEYAGAAVTDEGADVESQAVVRQTLDAVVEAFDRLPPIQRVLIALTFHQELDITAAAGAVYLEVPEARGQLEAAVCEIHSRMLLAVQAEGTGARRPARIELAVHVRSGDRCQAAELAAAPEPAKWCRGPCGLIKPLAAFAWRDRSRGYRLPYCRGCDGQRQRRYAAGAAAVGVR